MFPDFVEASKKYFVVSLLCYNWCWLRHLNMIFLGRQGPIVSTPFPHCPSAYKQHWYPNPCQQHKKFLSEYDLPWEYVT